MEEEIEKRRAYSEVVEILKLIEDEEKLEKIPFEVIEMIKNNSDPTYKPEISRDISIEEQNLSKQTYAIMGWIASKYWGINLDIEDNKNKEEIVENEEPKQETKEIKVYNDIEPEIIDNVENINPDELPILVSDLKWYQKIASKIIKYLKSILNFKHKKMEEGANE